MVNKKSTVQNSTTGSHATVIGGRDRLKSHFSRFNFTKSILFILIAFSVLLLLSGSAMAAGYVTGTPATSAGGAIPINTIEDLSNISNLSGNYILMADLDFTSLTAGSAYEQSLGWKVTVEAVTISGNDVTFKLTANDGSLATAAVQYSFGKKTGTATLSGGQFTVSGVDSGYSSGTPMTLLIGGTNPTAPAGERDFATSLEVTVQGDTRTSYHLGNFKPIGSSSTPFRGTFNGNHHKITGLETATFYGGTAIAQIHTGMFAYTSGATIKNVVTAGGSVTVVSINYVHSTFGVGTSDVEAYYDSNGVGMIVGKTDANSVIDNCNNSGTATASRGAGGIVGSNTNGSIVSNSENSGTMVTITNGAGGIVASNNASATVSNSKNTGTVTADLYAGGIAGGSNTTSTVSNSENSGTVTADTNPGGIIGYSRGHSTVSGSKNSGTVKSTGNNAGGIAGRSESSTVSNSENSGTVTAQNRAGGIVGSNDAGSTVSNSKNSGAVTTIISNAGGIVGHNDNSVISVSVNSGAVIVTAATGDNAGGITGQNSNSSTVSDSENSGPVTANLQVGGIVGNNKASTISGSKNSGIVTSTNNNAGGIAGSNDAGSTISGSKNSGTVRANNHRAGGIAGANIASSISNSTNSGPVTANADYAGGIAGLNRGSISVSFNEGTIQAKNYVGGIVGYFGTDTGALANIDITNCYNTGIVTAATNHAGGIAGHMIKGAFDIKINYTYNSAGVSITGAGTNFGGIVGSFGGTATALANIDKSYYIDTITGGTAAGTATPDADLKLQATYTGWDFINTWVIGPATVNGGYPYFESFVNMTIKTQPSPQTVFDGDRATFSVEMLKDAPYSYQWQISTDGGTTWTNAPGISTTSVYVTDPLAYGSTAQFRSVVTSLVDPSKTVTSSAGMVDVKHRPSGGGGSGGGGTGGAIIGGGNNTPPGGNGSGNNSGGNGSGSNFGDNGSDGNGSGNNSGGNGSGGNGSGNNSGGNGSDGNGSGNNSGGNNGSSWSKFMNWLGIGKGSNNGDTGSNGGIKTWFGNHKIMGYGGLLLVVVIIAGVAVYFVKFRGKDY